VDKGMNPQLGTYLRKEVLGGIEIWQTTLDQKMSDEIMNSRGEINAVFGNTVGTNDFYLGQGRTDGALKPSYTEDEALAYLKRAHEKGARNFEMESTEFAAFCLKAGIPAAIVCAALLDRLKGDQVTSTPEQLAEFSDNAERVVINYIRNQLQKNSD
jgi:uridine phosphorylase